MVIPSYPTVICPRCGAEVHVYHYDRRLFTHKPGRAGPLCPRSGTVVTARGRITKIN